MAIVAGRFLRRRFDRLSINPELADEIKLPSLLLQQRGLPFSGRLLRLRLRSESLPAAQDRPRDPRQTGRQRDDHGPAVLLREHSPQPRPQPVRALRHRLQARPGTMHQQRADVPAAALALDSHTNPTIGVPRSPFTTGSTRLLASGWPKWGATPCVVGRS